MKNAAIMICALAVLFGAPAAAAPKHDANAQARLATTSRSELSALATQTRDQLIGDPSQIGAVVEAAGAANPVTKAEIERGIVRAVEYLRCVDRAGYQEPDHRPGTGRRSVLPLRDADAGRTRHNSRA